MVGSQTGLLQSFEHPIGFELIAEGHAQRVAQMRVRGGNDGVLVQQGPDLLEGRVLTQGIGCGPFDGGIRVHESGESQVLGGRGPGARF